MCFNVLIENKDDHAKNFAFIYEDGWRLSPAYDLLPSIGFNVSIPSLLIITVEFSIVFYLM